MRRVFAAITLALAYSTAVAQSRDASAPEEEELRLHQAVLDGSAETIVLERARSLAERYPERPYPLVVLGDTLFRLRRLSQATRVYRDALERMNAQERVGALGQAVESSLAQAQAQVADFEQGLRQERWARLAGWGVLLLLACASAGAALLLVRERGLPLREDPEFLRAIRSGSRRRPGS